MTGPTEEGGETNDRRRDLFTIDESDPTNAIFDNKDLLTISHLPEESRIVGRDDQIRQIANEVEPVVVGRQPNSVVIYGKTGSGKSLVAKYVSELATREAVDRGYDVGVGLCDCSQSSKEASVVQTIAASLNVPESGVTIPHRGISADEYFKRLWQILDSCYDGALIVLDEIDYLKSDDVLMVLSRANEAAKTETPLGIIGISNKIDYRNKLSERVKSSFGHKEYIFDPYRQDQLERILENRRDAFAEGVLESGVISLAASLAAREHGDARKAMNLLKYAGEHAKRHDNTRVTEQNVRAAQRDAEAERLLSLISGLTSHAQYVLIAVANLTNHSDDEWFRTSTIVDTYEDVCEKEVIDPLSMDAVRDILNELDFLTITESNREHGGRGVGNYKEYKLLTEPETVFRMREREM
jgi:cell division control protein 6